MNMVFNIFLSLLILPSCESDIKSEMLFTCDFPDIYFISILFNLLNTFYLKFAFHFNSCRKDKIHLIEDVILNLYTHIKVVLSV